LSQEVSQPLDRRALTQLLERARIERQNGSPPHASRELFRVLREALSG